MNGGSVTCIGSNHFAKNINTLSSPAYVFISSGAVVDLTGNAGDSNGVVINPGGGVVVSGGCTVINSAGASVSIEGGTYTQINKDGTTA